MDEDESNCIIVYESLSQNCSVNKDKLKQIIVNETLSHNYSADVNKLCSTEIDKSDAPNFNVCNVYEYGRKFPDVSYERACMATEYDEYFTDILDTLNKYQDRHGQRLSSKKPREAVCRVMDEEEEEMERNINNITCHTSFQTPVTKSVKKKDASWSLERRLAADILDKMVG